MIKESRVANLPAEYQLLQPDPVHIPAVVSLFNVAAQHDADNPATETDLRRQWQQTRMEDVTLVADGAGQVVGVVGAVPMPSKQRLYVLFNTHPDHRAGGVSAFLMDQIEDYARRIQPAGGAAVTLVHPIDGRNLWKRGVLPDFGYQVVRGLWRVEIALDTAPEVPPFPAPLQLRTFNPDKDLTALQQLVARTFTDSSAPAEQTAWLNSVTRDGDYDPSLWYLLSDGAGLVAYALCYPDAHVGHVALVGVDAAWQGQGVAVALLRQSFRGFFERGIHTVEMHIDSAYPRPQALAVYEKAGMVEADALLIYEKVLEVRG